VDGTNGSWDRSKREGDRWEVCGHALTLFNPAAAAITATLDTVGTTSARHVRVRIPAHSNRELALAAWGAKTQGAGLRITTGYILVPQRTFMQNKTEHIEYGLLGAGQQTSRRQETTPSGPDLRVTTRSGHTRAGSGSVSISYAPYALVRVTVTFPGQPTTPFYDTTDDHGRLTLTVPAPRNLTRSQSRIKARVVVQGNAGPGAASVSRTLMITVGR